jgi:hypothetical protein
VNKTVLIIICDFLLISILAMVEFKPSETIPEVDPESVREDASEELLELMQLSLQNEEARRESLEKDAQSLESELSRTQQVLSERQSDLESTRESLELTEQEKEALRNRAESLDSELAQTRQSLELSAEEKALLAKELAEREARARQLQSELQAQMEAVAQREAELEAAESNLSDLESRQQRLQTELEIRDTEKALLQENLVTARAEVERARLEAERAQVRSENLAAGVSQLAQSSSALTEEILQAQTLSQNAIYQRFEQNRLEIVFQWSEKAMFSTRKESTALQTILLQTNTGVYAVFSTEGTPLGGPLPVSGIAAILRIEESAYAARQIAFLESEPSIAAIRIPASTLGAHSLEPFALETDPFRFATAVLVKQSEQLYGEIPVRLIPGRSNALDVENRLISRLFGEFSPSPGDYVFAPSGKLNGLMTTREEARLLTEFSLTPAQSLALPTSAP